MTNEADRRLVLGGYGVDTNHKEPKATELPKAIIDLSTYFAVVKKFENSSHSIAQYDGYNNCYHRAPSLRMISKVMKTPEGLAVLLHPEIVTRLGIQDNEPVEVTEASEGVIISRLSTHERTISLQDAIRKTNERFGDAFRRLAE